ncbi:hypothetical protein N4T77_00105 [Clostridium sp. CX1]|uniref:hypothetical protein n=1 Tax=Clostridium sp. CX1 TaxID=2978346 RepID=UPI0021C18864|nr:hypothetical protein [Clostridium sp. CX1]MCT8974990.1 hypothetical protein [Clostridium sp. CX1]
MYKVTDITGEVLTLDREGFKDYLVEALMNRRAQKEDIEEIESDISEIVNNETYTVTFDRKQVFTLIKENLKEFYETVSLTARVGFFVKAEDKGKVENAVFDDIEEI